MRTVGFAPRAPLPAPLENAMKRHAPRPALLGLFLAAPLWACTPGGAKSASSGAPAPAAPASTPAAPASTADKGGAVIARFDGQTLTAGELTAKLNARSPFERARMNTLERKKAFVEQLVRFELLANEAQRRGLDKDPQVIDAMHTVMVRELIQKQIDKNPANKKFDDAELKAYYDAHLQDFVRPEMVRLSAIVLVAPSKAKALARKPEAQAIEHALAARATDYSAFGALVSQKSEDAATKAVQGDLRFLSMDALTQRYGPEVAAAGFALKQNEISKPVYTDKGVYILKLTGRTPPVNTSFDKAKAMLGQRLWYQKRSKLFDDFVAELKKKANYQLDEAALTKFKVDPTLPTTDPGALTSPQGMPPEHADEGPSGKPPPMHMPERRGAAGHP